jgi:hypothetical protein
MQGSSRSQEDKARAVKVAFFALAPPRWHVRYRLSHEYSIRNVVRMRLSRYSRNSAGGVGASEIASVPSL